MKTTTGVFAVVGPLDWVQSWCSVRALHRTWISTADTGLGRYRVFGPALVAAILLVGCAQVPNQWVEDGPATTAAWDSPTAADLRANHEPAQQRHRDWESSTLAAEPLEGTHWPLYLEDPFVDKGHGREGLNKYHFGWEDYVAMPYCYSRFTLNWLMLPLSATVTPPFVLMESDGELSRQALGYDHDAARVGCGASEASIADDAGPEPEPSETEAADA